MLLLSRTATLSMCRLEYSNRIADIFRGVYISRISREGPTLLTLKSRNLIIESGCGQLECSLLPLCCALKKASLLSSSGGLCL